MTSFKKTELQSLAIKDVLTSPALHNMLYGGSRSGKTFLLVYTIFVRAFKCPNSNHAIIRKHLTNIRRSCWDDTIKKVIKLKFPNVPFKYNNTDLTITFPNGSVIALFGLDDKDRADRILGLEFSTILFEEVSELSYTSIQVALTRLAQKNSLVKKAYYSQNPTVKSHFSYKIFILNECPIDGHKLNPDDYKYIKMNPQSNLENIDKDYLKSLESLSVAQRKRFLDGDFSDDVEGALFRQLWIEKGRIESDEGITYDKTVISLDPSGSSKEGSDECGIILASKKDRDFYLRGDYTATLSPMEWSQKAVQLYKEFEADYIIAEVNFGAEMVKTCIRSIDPYVKVIEVRASKGKLIRAEPVSSVYELGYGHHVGHYPELEMEMVSYLGEGKSPNRLDAMVWAALDLTDQSKMIRPSFVETVEPQFVPGVVTPKVPEYKEEDRTLKEIIEDESIWDNL